MNQKTNKILMSALNILAFGFVPFTVNLFRVYLNKKAGIHEALPAPKQEEK